MDAETTILSINLIASNPKVRGGRPCIAGTGLRVIDLIMQNRFHNRTPDELVENFGITLAQAHAAFAYYYEHQVELDADIDDQIARYEQLRTDQVGSKPSILS